MERRLCDTELNTQHYTKTYIPEGVTQGAQWDDVYTTLNYTLNTKLKHTYLVLQGALNGSTSLVENKQEMRYSVKRDLIQCQKRPNTQRIDIIGR